MKCDKCGRDNLTERELEIHLKYYHMQDDSQQRINAGVCPDCHGDLWHENGCITCHSCGYSKC